MSRSIKELSLQYNSINESNTFTSGDIVEGRVVLEVTKAIKVDSFFVKLTGDADVRWTEGSGDNKRTRRDHERYFKLKQYFIQKNSKKGTGDRARKSCFSVQISAASAHPQSGTQVKEMKFFGSGKMSMAVTAEKTGYVQGETIRVFVDIDNSSSRDIKLKYSLKQQQTFIAGRSTNRGHKDIVKETRDRIPSGEKSKFILDMILPPDLTVTIENCRIIKVQYELKVYLDVSFASDPEVKFPVVILPFEQQCPPWQGFQPYPPPQPNLPYPGEQPPPPAGLYPNLYDPSVLPYPGAAAGVYPNPNPIPIQSGFHPAPSAPIYDPNQSKSSPDVSY
ncbi:arrestin domain-containing protein 3-like [Puntigrus tetrazona]|uniref:arrestin domain-containing protein 3-like n=1 Tax=Puntigrus tetrazona TaxID=1606681 RepID=UPI001C897D58|nr:arrestin domain-containing protein 3-like [Puntigrus tetrazona]